MNPIEQYYDRKSEDEWQRLERHRTEFAVTKLALADYLPTLPNEGPVPKIADIGGGPGRYAITLAQKGYEVTLVDLSRRNLALAQEKTLAAKVSLAEIVHANALDLAELPASGFDAVLLLGPLYHLLAQDERLQAASEAQRLLRPQGRLFAAFITRFAQCRYAAKFDPGWFSTDRAYVEQLLASGVHRKPKLFTEAYFAHPDEIVPFMESAGLSTIKMIGCEGIVSGLEEKINELEGDDWDYWVQLNYRLGQEPSLFGASDHLLYIGQKDS